MAEPRTIIVIDAATTSGVAEYEPGGSPRFYDVTFAAPGGEHHEAFTRMRRWLDQRLSLGDVTAIYLEAPISPGAVHGQSNANTALRLIGLWAVAAATAGAWRVRFYAVNCQDARERFIGEGNVSGARAKLRAFRMAERVGWAPKSHDQGDAATVLYWALCAECREHAPHVTDQMRREIAERCDREWLDLERARRERKMSKARRAA